MTGRLPASRRASSARPRADRWAHRRAEPRMLAFAWTVYLLAATALTFARVGFIEPVDAHVYRVSARAMLLTVAFGACALWPMMRLSQQTPARPIRETLKDLLVIVAPMQAVIWGQALLTGWPVASLGAVSLAVLGWCAICGGIVAIALAPGPGVSAARRLGGMLGVLGATGTGALVVLKTGLEGRAGILSPYTTPFALLNEGLTSGRLLGPTAEQWQTVAGVCLVAPAPWLVAAAVGGVAETDRKR